MDTCRWCRASADGDEVIEDTLRRYCTGGLTEQETQEANNDLHECLECVVDYHRARERVPTLHERLWKMETARLLVFFRDMLTRAMELEEEDLCFVEDGEEKPVYKHTPDDLHCWLRYPLAEVLKYPYLLCHRELCEALVNVLCKMEDMQTPPRVTEKFQGIYLLMVHPNETVRRWAISTARSIGRVDVDHFYDLQEVFSSMFYVIELGISLDLPDPDVNNTYSSGRLERIPSHLYDSKNEKNYWLGICMLLMLLDSQAMDSLFMGQQGSIPQCIMNTMTESRRGVNMGSDPFWPALHCFMIMLDRLGSKIWGQIELADAFGAITRADSYVAEINNIRRKTSGMRVKVEPEHDDDMISCSQIVYDCYPTERTNRSSEWSSNNENNINEIFEEMGCLVNVLQSEMGQGMRVYGSAFLWFIPFVRAVIELGSLGVVYVDEVIRYLYSEVDEDVLAGRSLGCDKVTEFFIRILVDVIELLLSKRCMETLNYCAPTWVKVVVQCSTLDETRSNTVPDRRGGSYKVTLANFGMGNRISAAGVGAMSQACMKLIRSLLKKGGRVDSAPDSVTFLNLLNGCLRESPPKVWSLTQLQSESLRDCLTKRVKAMADGSAAVVVPSAPPTPPADPPESATSTEPLVEPQYKEAAAGPSGAEGEFKFKDEPLWENDQDDFGDNLEDYLKVKKEPHSPVRISDYQSALEMNRLKPDIGKILEIRSRLNDRQNLDRIQAIASGKPEDPKQNQNGCKDVKDTPPTIPDCTKMREPSLDDDYDDEPLNVTRSRLKKSFMGLPDESKAEANDAMQSSVQVCSSAVGGNASKFIIISDDDDDDTKRKGASSTDKVTAEPSSDPETNDSPGRDYDGDLSESQVFEFETQENIVSAWGESHFDCPVKAKRPKHDTLSKAPNSPDPSVSTSGWVSDTQQVTDEDIEKACQQAEWQISKQNQDPPISNMFPKRLKSDFPKKCDNFIQPKPVPPQRPTKPGLADGKAQPCPSKKPVLIEPLGQIKKRKSFCATSENSSLSFVVPNPLTPAIVPPKKVRKPIVPQSVAERMGLKKKERKAFDLSQPSLDSLGELRTHGQNLHIESPKKSKRVCRKSKPQPKLAGKVGKKLLASQDMQYFRQSKGMLQKSTPATTALSKPLRKPASETLPKQIRAVQEPEDQEEDDDDDYSFLPCSQPDPSCRTEQNGKEANNDDVGETSKVASIPTDKTSFHQDFRGAVRERPGAEMKESCVDGTDEWMHLTQNEPTDMELCSQMEDMEASCEDYLHTQRDPVDMDVDMDSQPSDVQPKPLPALESQKAPPAAHTHSSVDDWLFVKPGMSPASQKKAKPSTTKIYGTSSRSASLCVELEKPVRPLPAASVTKAKVARPPPPALKAMLSPPVPKPTPPTPVPKPMLPPPVPKVPSSRGPYPPNQGVKSVVPSNMASNPPSYTPYSRPAHPNSKTMSPQYDPSHLIRAILKWEYHMFEGFKSFGMPNDLWSTPLKQVPTRFSNHQEYFNTMYPLLLINVFEEMVNEWHNSGRIKICLKVQDFGYSNHIARANFTASLNPHQEKKQLYPKEDDLVLLWLPENIGAYANDESDLRDLHAHFGYVSRAIVISNGGGQPSTLNLTIQTRGNVSSVDTRHVQCDVIGSLISTLREFRALCLAQSGIMGRPHILLNPHISVFTPDPKALPDLDMPEYNIDQTKAINCGVAMVKRQQRTPKILLIHGPPGTGKSKTIVGLLQRLFSDHSVNPSSGRHSKSRSMPVLLCAPSNAAIDSLMKKVILAFKEKCRNIHAPQGNCGDINLVRLGNEKTISKGLVLFSLDSQTAKKTQVHSDPDAQRRKAKLDQAIDRLSRLCAVSPKQSPEYRQLMTDKQQFLSEREKLSRQLKEFRSKRQEVQARLLQEAHVICCTLSTSGSSVLELAFRRLGHEPFSCVIVDEAGQAKETETLIPLLYRCPNFILVGDPEQLPPTVVSTKAKELGYDQSLMARLWQSLRQTNPQASPCIFLSIQYRMHPSICEFPSKYIYKKSLKNDCETTQIRCSFSWPFEPYRVFDVKDGRESKEKDSFSNMKEVKLVLMLLKLIGEKQLVRIGVITPYNAQKRRIREAIEKDKFPSVEVDTVDGFQGREMDCIIVSCVRASSEMGSIGFLANRQRMNVTITRAKFSLFILGHLRTLREQSDWGALIKDADSRGIIISTEERDFRDAAKKVLKPDVTVRRRGNTPTSPPPPTLIPMENTAAPVPCIRHRSSSTGTHSPTVSSMPPDWPRDPRLSARPSDPRLQEPIREPRHDRDRPPPAGPLQTPQPTRIHRDAYRRATIPQPYSSRSPRSHERHRPEMRRNKR